MFKLNLSKGSEENVTTPDVPIKKHWGYKTVEKLREGERCWLAVDDNEWDALSWFLLAVLEWLVLGVWRQWAAEPGSWQAVLCVQPVGR